MSNVAGIFREAAARAGSLPALALAEGRTVTFRALADRCDRVATGADREGLKSGERALVMIPMSDDLYAVLLGLLAGGAVPVFLDPWVGRRRVARLAAFAEPSACFGIPASHLIRRLDPALRRIRLTVTTGRRFGPWPARRTLAELERAAGGGLEPRVTASDAPALITLTTGSSGEPKGANRTHGFLAAQHRALQAEFPPEEGDVDMTMFPVFALNNLAAGVPTVVPRMDFRRVARTDGGAVVEQMRRHRVTTCTASPSLLDRVAERVRESPADRPRLRRVLAGGAPVSDEQLRAWREAFPETRVVVVYGSTEAEPVAHIDADERLALSDRPGRPRGYCVGRPCPAVRTRLIRIRKGPVEEGPDLDVPAGAVGELLVAGEHVCRGYYRNDRAFRENKLTGRDGTVWHRMGDTGRFDREGRFWLAGRVHTTIERDGDAVHAQLVEQAAGDAAEGVLRAAAVGVPDAERGEKVVVVAQVAAGADRQRAAAAVRDRLREAELPLDELVVTERALPLDPRHASKIDYGALRARLQRGRA